MFPSRSVMKSLGGALLVSGALLAATPGAMAATDATVLVAPTLTSATISPSGGGEVRLLFTPPPQVGSLTDYAIYANGKFLFRTPAYEDVARTIPSASAMVFLLSEGLASNGTYTFTVVAEDNSGDQSAPSNGLVPVAPAVLPTPAMTTAVIHGNNITLSWTPSHTGEVSGTLFYEIDANGQYFATVTNATTVTLPTLFDDPVEPYTVTPGTLMTVHARDNTFFSMSPVSNALPATQG